jgi:hypothetical protein
LRDGGKRATDPSCPSFFGRAAQLLLHDPGIDPGAFALVGMGVFYGGVAHIPLSALVLVCELALRHDTAATASTSERSSGGWSVPDSVPPS